MGETRPGGRRFGQESGLGAQKPLTAAGFGDIIREHKLATVAKELGLAL